MATNIKESYYSHDSLLPPQQFRSEVDTKYYNSYSNQIYVFPRALSTESSLDSSMKSLVETNQYNLHAQNPHTDAIYSQIRSSFKDNRVQKMRSNPLIEVKSAERGRKVEDSREKGENKNKKGVSLGPEELAGLYKKHMAGYKVKVKENVKVSSEAIQDLLEACEARKKGLVMKLVKGKDAKEKEAEQVYGIRQRIVGPIEKKAVDAVQKKEVKRIAGLKERKEMREVRDSRESKQSRDIVSFSKGFSEFLKQAKNNLLTELANNEKENVEVKAVKKEKEDDGRQAQETEIPREEVVLTEKRPRTSGVMSQSLKKICDMELKEKVKRNEAKPDIKKLDLYTTFKTTLSSKPVNQTKTTSNLARTQSPKAEKLQSQEPKILKNVQLVKAASEARESRPQTKQEKPKEPQNPQSREPATRDKTKEMRDLRLSSNKKVSICSTQLSEGMSTSRKASKPRATSNTKGGVTYYETQKSQRDRLHTEEKRERKDLIKEIVARTLDMARTTPMKFQDLQEFKDLKKSIEKRKKKDKNVKKEKKVEKKEEKGLAMSIVVESPTTCRRRDGPMSRVNLKVKTHSVVREYEARQREKLEARRKFADVRKFV